MKTLIADLKPGAGVFRSYFIFTAKEMRIASNQNPYMQCRLRDKTGEIGAKQWEVSECSIEVDTIVAVEASVDEYPRGSGKLQLLLQKLRPIGPQDEGRFDLGDLLPVSERPPADMMRDLKDLVAKQTSPRVAAFLNECLANYGPALERAPAAKAYHHAYIGGLLEHVLSLSRASIAFHAVYPDIDLNVLIAGSILHDIGKVVELSSAIGFRYTTLGILYGHVTLGFAMVQDLLTRHWKSDTPTETDFAEGLLHLVAAHHGQIEFGAAVEPRTKEALCFHHLDMVDSRMAAIRTAEKLPGEEEGLTAYIPLLKRAFWKGRKCLTSTPPPPPPPQAAKKATKENEPRESAVQEELMEPPSLEPPPPVPAAAKQRAIEAPPPPQQSTLPDQQSSFQSQPYPD